MALPNPDRWLPWSGAVAGVAWIAQSSLARTTTQDVPGSANASVITDNLVANHAAQGALVVMGMALLCFAAVVRSELRSGEAQEAVWSSVAYGGWVVTAAAIAQMVAGGWAILNGAATADDQAAVQVLGYAHFFAWAGLGVGLATALVATGLGGLGSLALPRWFGWLSVVLGVLAALGNAGIPPGGLVTYLLMPLWLVAASVIIARRRRAIRTAVATAVA